MSQEELILMSQKERDRLKLLHEANNRHITQREAAGQMGVTERWVRKLLARMRKEGDRARARFVRHDSTPENLRLLRLYLKRWGRPQAFYTDKASLFRTPRPPEPEEQLEGQRPRRQIGRALQELGIEWIPAHSPQAKGRIERFFGTAQDRLVKGLRKEGIDTLAGAQRYLERVFLPLWNRRFTVAAANPAEAHRPLGPGHNLAAILRQVERRVVAPDYTLQLHRQRYQIAREAVRAGLWGARVRMEKRLDGTVAVGFREHYLPVRKCGTMARQPLGEQPEPPRAVEKARLPASKARPHRWMEGFDLRRSKPLWAILRKEQAGPPQ